MKNRHAIRSRISEVKFRQLVRMFALDHEATQITILTGLNRNTINRYLRDIPASALPDAVKHSRPFPVRLTSMYRISALTASRANVVEVRSVSFCLRDLQTHWACVCRDCPGLPEKHAPGHHSGSRGIRRHRLHGWLAGDNDLVDAGYGKRLGVDHGRDELARGRIHPCQRD